MALANAPDTHDEPQSTRADSRLVRVYHHARIAECCTLDGVLTGERRAKQQSAGWRQFELGIEAIREFIRVAKERLGQTVMSAIEPRTHIVVALLNLVVRERQNSAQDSSGSRLLLVEAFVSRDEQSGHDTRPVGRNVDRAATDQTRCVHNHWKTLAGDRACCNVERRASVDSVPWLRLAPFLSRPSKAPPVAWSHMTTPPSLSPRNQLAAALIPSVHRWFSTTAAARAQASARAATSMGCWSKPGPSSSGPRPPTGVTERWPRWVSRSSSHSKSAKPCSKRAGRPSTEPAAIIASGSVAFA